MTGRILWLCDVDGIIAPIRPRSTSHLRPVFVGGPEKQIHVDQQIVTRIADLVDARLVDFQWLTTWGDRARTVIAPRLDLVGTRVAEEPKGRPRHDWWKVDVVEHHLALNPGAPIIWTDDEIALDDPLLAAHPNILALAPDHRVGLTAADLDRIEAFVSSHAAAPPAAAQERA